MENRQPLCKISCQAVIWPMQVGIQLIVSLAAITKTTLKFLLPKKENYKFKEQKNVNYKSKELGKMSLNFILKLDQGQTTFSKILQV